MFTNMGTGEADSNRTQSSPTNESVKQLLDAFRELLAASERVYDRQLSYAEKLLLLDGGTLTLTFTALGVVAAHLAPGHPAVHPVELYLAWSLLVSAMICFIAAQKCTLTLGNALLFNYAQILTANVKRIPTINSDEFVTIMSKLKVSQNAKFWGGISSYLLFIGEAFTISAFSLLLLFLEANAHQMMGN